MGSEIVKTISQGWILTLDTWVIDVILVLTFLANYTPPLPPKEKKRGGGGSYQVIGNNLLLYNIKHYFHY